MTARTAQLGIAAIFLLLGGWALFAPRSVIELAVTPEYRDTGFLVIFAMSCFGAQAILFGIMAIFVRFTSRAFLVFAILLLPFFVFDWYFHSVKPVLNSVGMLDAAGNVAMLALALFGWRKASQEEQVG